MQLLPVGTSDPTVWTHPRLRGGRVGGVHSGALTSGSATVRLGGELIDAGDLTEVDTTDSTTLDSAASEGATEINPVNVSFTGPRKGDTLVITDEAGDVFVSVQRRVSNTRIILAEPLPRAIADGADVVLTRYGVRLPASAVAEENAGEYGIAVFEGLFNDGTLQWTERWEEPFRVVRRITSIKLTPSLLTQLYPTVRGLRSSSDTDYEEAIEASWVAVMEPMLAAKGVMHEDIITDDVIVPTHAVATALHLARQARSVEQEYVDRLSAIYEESKTTLFARIDLAIRSQVDETPEQPTPGSEPVRMIRIGR